MIWLMIDHTIRFERRLRGAAIVLMLLILPAAWLVSQLGVDNRQEKLVNQSGEAAQLYRAFKTDFGHDEFVIMALSGRDLFDEDVLDDMLDLVDELEDIEQVASVIYQGAFTIVPLTFGFVVSSW